MLAQSCICLWNISMCLFSWSKITLRAKFTFSVLQVRMLVRQQTMRHSGSPLQLFHRHLIFVITCWTLSLPLKQISMYGRMTSMYGRMTSMYGRMTSMYGRMTSMYGRMTSMYGRMTSMYGRMTSFFCLQMQKLYRSH